MRKKRVVCLGIAVAAVYGVFVVAVGIGRSQPPPVATTPEPAPPPNQTYTGAKRCASCHFKQFMSWKKTKHAKEAWESVAVKYRADPKCLICHTTGYGTPTGYKDQTSTALEGTTCEACHGPGSIHEEVCKQFLNKKTLTKDEDKVARDSIYKILPENVCIRCHISQDHEEHPKYDKK